MKLSLPCTLAILALLAASPPSSAAPPHTVLLKEAIAAAKAGDNATALIKLEAAAKLRPDYPRIQLNLARLYAEAKRANEALAALQRVANMGVAIDAAKDPAFAPLTDLPRFQALAAQLAVPATPAGTVTTTTLAGVTGIIESPLVDATTGAWYFGDVRNRCVWRRHADGAPQRFTGADAGLDGVFKLALSSDRKVLWAATAAVGVMKGTPADEGSRSALVAIDFSSGHVIARHAVPADERKHLLGDFLAAVDGAIFATDSYSPVIWRLSPEVKALEPWLESDDFLNLQGLAFSADGQTLYVADYSNGIWRIDVATKKTSLLVAPPNATFFGIDGLYTVGDSLLAIQNGVNPQRVLHIQPASDGSPSSTRTFAIGHPAMTDLALGTVQGNRFHFIADSGWALFDPPPATEPAARTVTVYSLPLE